MFKWGYIVRLSLDTFTSNLELRASVHLLIQTLSRLVAPKYSNQKCELKHK